PDPADLVVSQGDLWVTDRANNVVFVIDVSTNAVLAQIPLPTTPEGIAAGTLPANGQPTLFVALRGTSTAPDNRVALINALTKTLPSGSSGFITVGAVGSQPTGLYVASNTNYLYVA